jgi:hypothetical protein
MVYDVQRQRLVLFGGSVDREHKLNDLWVYQRDGEWRELRPQGEVPQAREGCCFVYVGRGKILLFGGGVLNPDGKRRSTSDMWLLDDDRWTELHPPKRPPALIWGGVAWDEARGVVVLFGGIGPNKRTNDLWEYPVPR